MFGIKFTHTPKPRQFNYKPIYYNPEEEERKERRAAAEANAEDKEHYVPGSYIRNARKSRMDIGEGASKLEKELRRQRMLIRLIIFIVLLLAVGYALMRSQVLEVLLSR